VRLLLPAALFGVPAAILRGKDARVRMQEARSD
jgi:hypothetical protein